MKKLSESDNFEEALSIVHSNDISDHVARVIRGEIVCADWRAMLGIARTDTLPPLSKLFQHLLQSNCRKVQVITTNYDRIAECAAERVGYGYYAGFSHGYLRQLVENNTPSYRVNNGVVNVWKVHGSVDWFYNSDQSGDIIALPVNDGHPGQGWDSAIILPGRLKYELAHAEPFRTVIREADAAIVQSKSVLCIGFGFNDMHLLPKLKQCCQKSGTTLVILAKELTKRTKEFFQQCDCHSRLALENASTDGKCRIFSSKYPDGVEIDGDFWCLSSFMSLV